MRFLSELQSCGDCVAKSVCMMWSLHMRPVHVGMKNSCCDQHIAVATVIDPPQRYLLISSESGMKLVQRTLPFFGDAKCAIMADSKSPTS